MPLLIQPLFDGPLDIIGDIHGESEALHALLGALGYDASGDHPEGRRLVFLGDLGDRGPDSPAVIETVRHLVGRGHAQCVLGNHELNLLRLAPKHGNRWFLDPQHAETHGEFRDCKAAPEELKSTWREFFSSLPLVLERPDLRVVHAAWHEESISALRLHDAETSLEAFKRYEDLTNAQIEQSEFAREAERERLEHATALVTETATVPLLSAIARLDELRQMQNPIRIVTSGLERATEQPFWANGQWRMSDRVRWWNEYTDPTPVVVGHYWRVFGDDDGRDLGEGERDLFEGCRPNQWLGKDRNVFCVDFSVGGRYRERTARGARDDAGGRKFTTRLGAVRWPERQLFFDDGSPPVSMTR